MPRRCPWVQAAPCLSNDGRIQTPPKGGGLLSTHLSAPHDPVEGGVLDESHGPLGLCKREGEGHVCGKGIKVWRGTCVWKGNQKCGRENKSVVSDRFS